MQNLFYPPPRFFPEAWSLSVEEWFYICFPVIAFFAVKVDKQKGLLLSILTLILFPLIYKYYKSFQFEVTGYNYEVYFRKIVLARIDSIAIGVLASYIKYYYNFIFTKYKYVFLAIGIASIVLVSNDFYSGNSYLIFFSFSFSLSLFFVIPWFDSLIKYPKYFGKIVLYFSVTSYSLYLIHLSLILITIQSFINLNSKTETAIGYLIYIIVCPVLALFNYNYFERPILNWRNRKVKE
jgi:peptidoglycan/LPS O-acetylase OafA/YrhL